MLSQRNTKKQYEKILLSDENFQGHIYPIFPHILIISLPI